MMASIGGLLLTEACIIPLAVGSTVVPLMLEKTEGKDRLRFEDLEKTDEIPHHK